MMPQPLFVAELKAGQSYDRELVRTLRNSNSMDSVINFGLRNQAGYAVSATADKYTKSSLAWSRGYVRLR